MDHINVLPTELLEYIFRYLSVDCWKTCCCVCNRWHKILRGQQSQCHYCLSLNRTFETQLSEYEKRIFPVFNNVALVQWVDPDDDDDSDGDDDDGDDEEDEEEHQPIAEANSDEMIFIKYLYEPTPESNISELLFSLELDLDSLELCTSFESCQDILGNRLKQIANLRELTLNLYVSHSRNPDSSVLLIEHDRIETLLVDLPVSRINFDATLPKLKTLALLTDCRSGFQIMKTHCSQLQSLEVQFQDAETMDNMLSLTFPNLTKFQARLCRDKAYREFYKETRNRLVDQEKQERFIRAMPKLKILYVESNLLLFRIANALARYAHKLEELTLECQQIEFPQLKAIESIRNLKTLHLLYSKIASVRILPSVNMPLLEKLSLLNNESHVIFNSGLCNLKSLKVTFWTRTSHKALHKICNKLSSLEQLELLVYSKLGNTSFRELHKLTKLVFFSISNCELKAIHWSHCSVMPNLRRIILNDCRLDLTTLLHIPFATLFPGLKELFLDSCNIDYAAKCNLTASFDSNDDAKHYCLQQLRLTLPKCAISLHDSFAAIQ